VIFRVYWLQGWRDERLVFSVNVQSGRRILDSGIITIFFQQHPTPGGEDRQVFTSLIFSRKA